MNLLTFGTQEFCCSRETTVHFEKGKNSQGDNLEHGTDYVKETYMLEKTNKMPADAWSYLK